jgi:uncharacterized protein YdeI (YjbR/CyaY-like superfamily)
MEITDTFYTADREEWRRWLMENYKTAADIWLVYPLKHSGLPRVSYNDAVEEALCFDWIDSTNKKLDENRNAQRFSPRRPRSGYSQINKERLRRLVEKGKVMPEYLEKVQAVLAEEFVFPADIEAALRANERAWENFQSYSGAYQRIRVAYVDSGRRRPGEFEKRLKRLIEKTELGKQFGFGIEDFY